MTGCRNCEQVTSGDCGAHGGGAALAGAPGIGGPLPCGHPVACSESDPEPGGSTWACAWCAEVARLTAELAAARAAILTGYAGGTNLMRRLFADDHLAADDPAVDETRRLGDAPGSLHAALTPEQIDEYERRDPPPPAEGWPGGVKALEAELAAERTLRAEAEARALRLREALDGLVGPWCRKELDGWSIVGMNHYSVASVRRLFVSMAKDGRCIKAESAYEPEVWTELARLAGASDSALHAHVAAAVAAEREALRGRLDCGASPDERYGDGEARCRLRRRDDYRGDDCAACELATCRGSRTLVRRERDTLRAALAGAREAEREACAAVLDAVVREHREEDRQLKAELLAAHPDRPPTPVHGEPGYFCEDYGCGSLVDLAAAIRARGERKEDR